MDLIVWDLRLRRSPMMRADAVQLIAVGAC
eukprot:SAG11_NODE_30377_length_301_cov_1.504950_1_plen_29_part_01